MSVENYSFDENSNKTAICLIGANRFDYFKQTFDSILPQINNRDLYVFLDIPLSGDGTVQKQHADYVLSNYPQAHVIKQTSHAGLGKQMIFARQYIYLYKRYARSFILEDDLVFSPGGLDLTEHIMDWTDKNYSNVCMVQIWSEFAGKSEDVDKHSSFSPFDITACQQHFWGYLLNRKGFLAINQLLSAYLENFLCNIPEYKYRNHQQIVQWKHNVVQQMSSVKEHLKKNTPNQFPADDETGLKKSLSGVSGQDAVTMMALYVNNLVRVCPVLGRNKYLGEFGEHFNPQVFNKKGFNNWKEYSTPEDATCKDFKEVKAHEHQNITINFS